MPWKMLRPLLAVGALTALATPASAVRIGEGNDQPTVFTDGGGGLVTKKQRLVVGGQEITLLDDGLTMRRGPNDTLVLSGRVTGRAQVNYSRRGWQRGRINPHFSVRSLDSGELQWGGLAEGDGPSEALDRLAGFLIGTDVVRVSSPRGRAAFRLKAWTRGQWAKYNTDRRLRGAVWQRRFDPNSYAGRPRAYRPLRNARALESHAAATLAAALPDASPVESRETLADGTEVRGVVEIEGGLRSHRTKTARDGSFRYALREIDNTAGDRRATAHEVTERTAIGPMTHQRTRQTLRRGGRIEDRVELTTNTQGAGDALEGTYTLKRTKVLRLFGKQIRVRKTTETGRIVTERLRSRSPQAVNRALGKTMKQVKARR